MESTKILTEEKLLSLIHANEFSVAPVEKCYITNAGKIVKCTFAHQNFASRLRVDGYASGRGATSKLGILGVPAIEELGWIRVNLGREAYISLNDKKPTFEQYDTLIRILDTYFTPSHAYKFIRFGTLYIYLADAKETAADALNKNFKIEEDQFMSFNVECDTVDDIIKAIKRYYSAR